MRNQKQFTNCLALCLLLCAASAFGQTTPLSALAIVERAVQEAGGENWARPKTLQLKGQAIFYARGNEEQKLVVNNYRMWRVYPTENQAAHTANGKVRFDAFANDKLFFQIAFDGKNSSAKFSPEAEGEREAAKWENSFGFGILRFARDPARITGA